MPTYDFECTRCHHRFEQRRSFSDNGDAHCPVCQGKARRLISAPPIIFKGKGFYVTDHRQSPPPDNGGSATTDTKTTDTKTKDTKTKDTKKETKPAATTE